MATQAHYRLLTVTEFLRIDFGPDMKAELDDGVIQMMAGGTRDHARVQMNLYALLRTKLRGSICRPYGSDMAIRTRASSIRHPDMTIDCGESAPVDERVLDDPRVVVEVLSPTTRDIDLGVKLDEYLSMASLDCIAFVDPDLETLRTHRRDVDRNWVESDDRDLVLASLGLTIPHAEIFARD